MTLAPSAGTPVRPAESKGFTLVELMVTLVVLGVVMISLMAVMYGTIRSKTATTNQLESVQAVRAGLDMLTRDLRSAGYGADLDYSLLPQPSVAYIDSSEVLINENLQPFPDSALVHTPPLAYDPNGSPRPFPLNGTPYAPPIRYRSGAELVRWTLDVNNDGAVDGNDLTAPDGADASHSPNPNDFVLVRQVYGDSTGNVAGANGGASERIALVNKPGAGVPAIFTVYFKGSVTPWDWKNGPVPPSQLAQISRISVQLTASSPRRNQDGTYARTTMRTEVASSRNLPDFGLALCSVSGYVFNDKNTNLVKDTGEPGIPNAYLMLGKNLSAYTDAAGHYVIKARAGTYRLKHIAPTGYGILTAPDSTTITLASAGATYSFADTARTGGFVHVRVYRDLNGNGYRDTGEPGERDIKVTGTPGPDVEFTGSNGETSVFAQVGAFTVTLAPPDSFLTTTTNPVTGIMMNGDTASVAFGVRPTPLGTVAGRVFRDVNKNGILDSGEQGMQSVWVGVTRDAGTTVSGYAMTDANGDYTIQAPVNDPPHTASYSVFMTPPSGYYATSATALAPVWVNEGTPVTDRNFGVLAFQLISLDAARVLSLANGDLVEKDWPSGQPQSRARDLDLVLGSDANGADQISVWLNRYDSSPLFDSAPDYNRSAAGGVLALAVDTLDAGPNLGRERGDVVAGTDGGGAKENFFVWLTQGSSGNEGYLPTSPTRSYQTKDRGDVYAVLTADLSGTSSAADGVDILVGTASRNSGRGTIELWRNNNAATPDWKQIEIYPNTGSFPNKALGEVTAMALADFDGDGLRDLVVTARTIGSSYSGQLIFLRNQGRTASPVFVYASGYTLAGDLPTSLAVADIDADGHRDVVVGTRSDVTAGGILYWRNSLPSAFSFTQVTRLAAPGLVASVVAADFGGDPRPDVAVGYRASSTGYGGGVRIYYSDLGTLTGTGVDPSGGSVQNFVPAITTGNFNYGLYPSAPFAPYLTDMAIGVKTSDATGALVVIVR
jgi:prepilin-type N-terminal cleavage/methylation domain-containing protein